MSTSVSVQTQVDVGLVFSMDWGSPEPGVGNLTKTSTTVLFKQLQTY